MMSGSMEKKRIKGVTLIELMITLAIIGVIAAIAVPMYTDYIETAQRAAMKTNIQSIEFMMDSFNSGEGDYPRADGDYLVGADLLSFLEWAPSASDQSTYVVSDVTAAGYTVTASHPNEIVETN
jgi:prepilin-type N-terminal cleavage/methylation domain-containing protein